MPTSGTHVTIIQRIAADPAYAGLLGNPDPKLSDTDPESLKMRYACLGSVGPDIFYALADYGGAVQDLENFLVKIAATFSCIGEVLGKVDRYVSGLESIITLDLANSLKESARLVTGAVNEGVLALIASEVNLWPVFEPARQRDLPRNNWFWADYLHYIRTGTFARTLLEKSGNDPNLRAYALGYLTHYVTDVVGHPYVNQVVGAPWRLAWQRHHLVENFIDAYVWDRWHASSPPPPPPSTEEQPLDQILSTPNSIGSGAPYTFARINDWINIGEPEGIDPIDGIIQTVCDKIQRGLFDIGGVEDIEPTSPTNSGFKAWTELMADAIRTAYDEGKDQRPMNLARMTLPGGKPPRPDGYPTPEDIASAYSVFRLVMKIGTEEKIQKPLPPAITADVAAAVKQVMDQVAADLAAIPAPPSVPMSGSFNINTLLDALISAAEWAGAAAAAFGRAVGDFLAGVLGVAATLVTDAVKYVLYMLNSSLFALYRSLRDVLVLQSYATPYTEEITRLLGGLDGRTLWRSSGNAPVGTYPHEELVVQRQVLGGRFNPARFPGANPERPVVRFVAPYAPPPGTSGLIVTPDAFIDAPLGPNSMFFSNGPRVATVAEGIPSFADTTLNFGGALANSKLAIDIALGGFPNDQVLPDYNLDGDRGYAWPCWDVDPAPKVVEDPPAPKTLVVGDPLAPDAPANLLSGIATVRAARVSG